MPSISRLLICLACILAGSGADEVQAGKRVALVIGNGDYVATGKLPNPPNDAKAIAALLRDANFDIVEMRTHLDLTSTGNSGLRFLPAEESRYSGQCS